MQSLIINGGRKLKGEVSVSGAKNVALKLIVASLLTDEKVVIKNVPRISDLFILLEIIKELGVSVSFDEHTVTIQADKLSDYEIPLDAGARIRASSILIAPLLVRLGKVLIPNPGGCRIGARPVDRTIDGLSKMGVSIRYVSQDGYFHAHTKGLHGATYRFEKNTHTGTETLLIAAVAADGKTVLQNAAQELEVDELIAFLNSMGAKISREGRTITIYGVGKLHGTQFTVSPDRNEVVTFAAAAAISGGDITVKNAKKQDITAFLSMFGKANGEWKELKNGSLRFWTPSPLTATDIETSSHPGFMTDWQGPWAVLMTQATGVSLIHETVYEDRFGYIGELLKMGAHIELFNPKVKNPDKIYNFNWADNKDEYCHAAKIYGPTSLHNAIVNISDLRAGATLVLAALAAKGKTVIFGVEHLDRGYEAFEERLRSLGADIKRVLE